MTLRLAVISGRHSLYPIQTRLADDERDRPSVLFACDSFGTALAPMLAESFSRCLVIRLTDGDAIDIPHDRSIDPELVDRWKPDIVVEEFAERKLMSRPPTDHLFR